MLDLGLGNALACLLDLGLRDALACFFTYWLNGSWLAFEWSISQPTSFGMPRLLFPWHAAAIARCCLGVLVGIEVSCGLRFRRRRGNRGGAIPQFLGSLA